MHDPMKIAEAYLAAWNEADAGRRRALLSQGWAEAARYADPLMQGEGREGIARMIETARSGFPGHGFTLRGQPDAHGPFLRFSWDLAPEGGAPVAQGSDVLRLDGRGRIQEVIGFLDRAAA
ncbi:nuclear transport factor 2 family protein [Roseomonas marmotae]|uniref:Nuclear transport factor 2 family protein n=1 Tax=Roseomonas marmotae TaxID=2768161 RepID=A0ABS3KGW3_9PROT|nr:nuclear transport factor 2 family protein [Roseomonas marmotae]MBO1076724.1 nuclear transport factor 2 family protein [Roseomonas marmotae]QTI77969.1 nuclear transport factor 2 family protein [Roseomonas marmotae]